MQAIKEAPHLEPGNLPRRTLIMTVVGLMLGMLLGALDGTIVGTAMPRVIADLNGFEHYAWVTVAYLVSSTTMVPIVGKLSDLYGRKWFFLAGIVIFLLGSALSGASQSMTQLIIFRGVQGIGAGVMQTVAFVVIADLFPPAQRAKFQGLFGAVFGLASIVGPALGGIITDGWGWRWVFYINLPVGALALAVLFLYLPNFRHPEAKPSIDFLGVGTLVLWVVPLLLALSWGGSQFAWNSPAILGLLGLAAVMFVAFILAETRAAEPILPLSFFKNDIFSASAAIVFMTGVAMFGVLFYIPLFIQGVIPGATASSSGGVITPMMLSFIGGSIVTGQLISRWGRYRWVGAGAMVLMVLGIFLLVQLDVSSGYGEVLRAMILVGLGIGGSMPIYTVVVQNAMPQRNLGAATSAIQFFRSMGGTIGTAILGTVLTNGYTTAFHEQIPTSVKSAIPPERLAAFDNPQVLLSAQAQAQMHQAFGAIPGGPQLLEQILLAVRTALALAVHQVFLAALGVAVVAFFLSFLLREVPLRGRAPREQAAIERTPVEAF